MAEKKVTRSGVSTRASGKNRTRRAGSTRNAAERKKRDKDIPEEIIAGRQKKLAYRAEIVSFFARAAVMAAVLFILFGMIFGITPMNNNDMSPRISAGDLMLYYRLEKDLISSDVVVYEKEGKEYTGRIVARGGDTVEITEDSSLKVNGSVVLENNIYYITPQYESDVTYPVTLEQNQYFILGDFREGAADSRYFGAVDISEIKGKVITVIRRSDL